MRRSPSLPARHIRNLLRRPSSGAAWLPAIFVSVVLSAALLAGLKDGHPRDGESAVTPSSVEDAPVFAFGPVVFELERKKPQTLIEQFQAPEYFAPKYTLVLENGAADGTLRVDQAEVILNGLEVFNDRDFARGP